MKCNKNFYYYRKIAGFIGFSFCGILTIIALSVLLFILIFVTYHAVGNISFDVFTQLPAPVGKTGGGIGNAILGTLELIIIATSLSILLGISSGIYLSEYASKGFTHVLEYIVDTMNALPSIVIGIFVYTIIVLPFKSFSALSGGIALGLIMLPGIIKTTKAFLDTVPHSVKEAGLSLGIHRWKVVLYIVLPSAYKGLTNGILLNLSRISGETAPLIFTILGSQYWSFDLFEPIAALPLTIYIYAISPYPDWHNKAWSAAFVLIVLILTINCIARLFISRNFIRSR